LVNESAEMLGAAPLADDVAPAELELELELELDELPQAATTTLAAAATAAIANLLFSKCMDFSSSLSN
jgi:hypothetical protein